MGIVVKNLTVEYSDNFTAVNNLSFVLETGSLTALCGLYGSGKSTVANAVCGLIKYSGEILFDGAIPENPESGERGVGYLPSTFNLVGSSVDKVLNYGYRIRKLKSEIYCERQRKIMEICEIEHLRGRKISSLSVSEKHLVAIARLFMRENLLYVIDADICDCAEKIFKLKNFFGATILYLSSENDCVVESADKKILLRNGKIEDENSLFARKFYDPFLNVCELNVKDGVADSAFFNRKIGLSDGKYYIAAKCENIAEGDGAEVVYFERQNEKLWAVRVNNIPYFIYSQNKICRVGCADEAMIFDTQGHFIDYLKNLG